MNKLVLFTLVAVCTICICNAEEPKKKSADEIATELNQKLVYLQNRVSGGSQDAKLGKFYENVDVAIEKLKRSGLKKRPSKN